MIIGNKDDKYKSGNNSFFSTHGQEKQGERATDKQARKDKEYALDNKRASTLSNSIIFLWPFIIHLQVYRELLFIVSLLSFDDDGNIICNIFFFILGKKKETIFISFIISIYILYAFAL